MSEYSKKVRSALDVAVAAIGGEPRSGQIEMAEAVANALSNRHHLLVQAGTGTGKSLAYLVPALVSGKKVLVATETGMLHQLRKANPLVIFEPVNRAAVCKYMKMNTPEKLLEALRTGKDEVTVPREIADRARLSVERMIAIGTPSRTKE